MAESEKVPDAASAVSSGIGVVQTDAHPSHRHLILKVARRYGLAQNVSTQTRRIPSRPRVCCVIVYGMFAIILFCRSAAE